MTNGDIDDAEIDALLADEPSLLTRYLVVGTRELTKGQRQMKSELTQMRNTCEKRGRLCPGMHSNIADPAVDPAQLRTLAAETARGLVRTAATVAVETVHTAEVAAKELADTPEEGDMKRAWRVGKWVVAGAGIVLLNQLGSIWFGK